MLPDGVWNDRHRALLILLRRADGSYARAAVATKLIYCSTCGGMRSNTSGGSTAVEIKSGVLVVTQLSGSREATDLTQRFRHDAASGRFQLIGEDVSEYDRAAGGGKSTSTNYLTGVRVTKRTRVLRGGRESVTSKTTRVPRATRYIEEMDYERQ